MQPQQTPTGIVLTNNAALSIWVTVYNMFGSQIQSGCVAAGASVLWQSGYTQGQSIKVLAELKQDASDCSGSTTYRTDTTQSLGDYSIFTFQQGDNGWWDFAAGPNNVSVTITSNCADYNVWVTLYGASGDIVNSGCLANNASLACPNGVSIGDTIKVRAEGKAPSSCDGNSWISTDTTQQVGLAPVFTVEQGTGGPYINCSGCI